MESPKSARAFLGVTHAPLAAGACEYIRPAVVDPALSSPACDDHRPHPGRLRNRRTWRPRSRLLGTRCDPYVNRMLTGEDFDFHCHSNRTRAIAPHGLTEFDVHDVLNVFQCTGLNLNDQYFMKACPAKKGDYLEFFAEIDLLCALSTCPGGDLSLPMWGPDARDPLEVCRPLGVEVYRLAPQMLDGWSSPEVPPYRGLHGMRLDTSGRGGCC